MLNDAVETEEAIQKCRNYMKSSKTGQMLKTIWSKKKEVNRIMNLTRCLMTTFGIRQSLIFVIYIYIYNKNNNNKH